MQEIALLNDEKLRIKQKMFLITADEKGFTKTCGIVQYSKYGCGNSTLLMFDSLLPNFYFFFFEFSEKKKSVSLVATC